MWTDGHVFGVVALVTFLGWYVIGGVLFAIAHDPKWRSDAVGTFFGQDPDKGIPWWGRALQACVLSMVAGVLAVMLRGPF